MSPDARRALVAIPVAIAVGIGIAIAGGQGGIWVFGVPVFHLLVDVAFLMQWLAFVPAYLLRSERFFDLTGSLTYISLTLIALLLVPAVDGRSVLLAALIVVWAARLGAFLFRRIRREGKDARFDQIRGSFFRFLTAWTLQGLWVVVTAGAALAAITTSRRETLGWIEALGFLIWAVGFATEALADAQKRRFRQDARNAGRFIATGLWAYSRHPNYFGEIVLWVGVALIAMPVLRGWQWITLISPVFVFLLLTRVSGIPLLEEKADQRWGGREDYETYKKETPVLIPRLPKPGVGPR